MYFLIVLPFLLGLLNEILGVPYGIRYLLDAVWVMLLGFLYVHWKNRPLKALDTVLFWILLFLLYTFLVYLVQYQSILYYLWGLRNNFRFFVAFLAFITFLTLRDVTLYLKLFDFLFWVNVAVSLIQFYFLEYSGDSLGGIFGTGGGVNGYTNMFFIIVLTKSVVCYLEKKESTISCVCKSVAAVLVSAMAELKFFFAEFVVILLLAVIFTNFTWRKILLILGGAVAVVAGATLLTSMFPNFAGWFSLEWMLEAASSNAGYTDSGDLNRLNAISQINTLWLRTWGQRLFGLGLGNCDTSSALFLNTPFFQQYGDMHYSWLSHAFMYLECGWLGMIFYFGFFVLVYFAAGRIEKSCEGIAKTYCRISRILAVMCIFVAVYNSSLRMEAGYMAYFVLAIPFAMHRQFNPAPVRRALGKV